eukprot:gene5425-7515_t
MSTPRKLASKIPLFEETDGVEVLSAQFKALSHNNEYEFDTSSAIFHSSNVLYRSMPISIEKPSSYNEKLDPFQNVALVGKQDSIIIKSSNSLDFPDRPYILCKTIFRLKIYPNIVGKIGDALTYTDVNKFDIEYSEENMMWKGKYLCGSSSCEVYVSLYKDRSTPQEVIVEFNRVKGDHKPFFSYFKEVKNVLLQANEVPSVVNVFNFGSLPIPSLSDEVFIKGIDMISCMSGEGYIDTKDEAAKMLCDLANHESLEQLALPQCVELVIRCVENLTSEKSNELHDHFQHALVAMAMFVDKLACYQDALVKSDIIDVVLRFAQDSEGSGYATIQMRRECGKILAKLTGNDTLVAEIVSRRSELVSDWVSKESKDFDLLKLVGSNVRETLNIQLSKK